MKFFEKCQECDFNFIHSFFICMIKKIPSFLCYPSSPWILASPIDDFSQLFCRALGVSTPRDWLLLKSKKQLARISWTPATETEEEKALDTQSCSGKVGKNIVKEYSEMFYNYYGCPIRSTDFILHLHLHWGSASWSRWKWKIRGCRRWRCR